MRSAVEHWHGATPNSGFAYLAVTPTQKGKTIWLEPVSDKDQDNRSQWLTLTRHGKRVLPELAQQDREQRRALP